MHRWAAGVALTGAQPQVSTTWDAGAPADSEGGGAGGRGSGSGDALWRLASFLPAVWKALARVSSWAEFAL